MTDITPIKTALLSVSDKTGIVELAQQLVQLGIKLLSTGGTFKLLANADIPVEEVSNHTGFPEIMDGRVKTLHPKIHGGILARRDIDQEVMTSHQIEGIDLVVVNLYPFKETISKANVTLNDAIENIDIGGPTMVRAAAKNHAFVNILVNPNDYSEFISTLTQKKGTTQAYRLALATKAFVHTAEYDSTIAQYLTNLSSETDIFPNTFTTEFYRHEILRYGENAHQKSAFYTEKNPASGTVANAKQLNGKALSYNNIADTDAAIETVSLFDEPACVIVKHANPCGVATDADINTAYQRAFKTDPESAFGGIIAFNRELDAKTAQSICDQQFVEVIAAPSVTLDAIEVIKTKQNVRLLEIGNLNPPTPTLDYKKVNSGLLVQEKDSLIITESNLSVVSKRQPDNEELKDLLFAFKVAKMVKSNAIVYAKNRMTIGVGAGQMSRVNSARIAAIKAEHAQLDINTAVMASDAFFPFRDGIDNAAAVGIKAIIQPGGSIRDQEIIDAANEHNIAMVFTGIRHFRH